MTTKDLKRPRGCSRSNVYRLAKLARQERYGGNCTTPTAFVAKEEQLIPPVLQHFQGKRWSGIASTKHHKLLLDAVTTPTGSKPYKVKMHRATDDLQLAYRCQRPLEQLSDIPSSDATDKMDRGGKRKRQPIDRSDFTCEVEEKRKHAVYEVDIDYSPPPPQLENMSHACSSPKRWTLGSMENLPTFSNPIASSPPAAHSEAMCKNDTVKEVRQLKGNWKKRKYIPSCVGGTSIGECTRNVVRTLLTDDVAKTVNWRGVNNRVSIASSTLAATIVESIMKKAYPGVSHSDVRGTI
ncbi:hypothetical protein P879_00349 [Paragonimus westermani]|uniref:DUF4806 domain-containing protein n=1 Tax=Paragonimus westermani TaxID=34504 RepID=A0A8T0DWW8_9TREM|nr:hypothetical protein P879_00349 [Paragonimus westermani]